MRYLQENGTLRCTPDALDKHSEYAGASVSEYRMRPAYDWMALQLRLATGAHGLTYPLWAWIKKPSLIGKERRRYCGEFLLTAIVPRRRLLISDYGQWHNCLMGGPVTISEQESEYFDGLEKTHDDATWKSLVQSTWHRVFDFSSMPGEQPYWRLLDRTVLQACVDEIRMDEIVKIRPL